MAVKFLPVPPVPCKWECQEDVTCCSQPKACQNISALHTPQNCHESHRMAESPAGGKLFSLSPLAAMPSDHVPPQLQGVYSFKHQGLSVIM